MVYHDEQWKNAPEVEPALKMRNRVEQQEWADRQYAEGRISLCQWRHCFDYISTLDANGSPLT